MVEWGIPEKILQIAVQTAGIRSIGPPVKSYDQVTFLPNFPIVITMGDPVRRKGDIFWKNTFSDISFYLPQESTQ